MYFLLFTRCKNIELTNIYFTAHFFDFYYMDLAIDYVLLRGLSDTLRTLLGNRF